MPRIQTCLLALSHDEIVVLGRVLLCERLVSQDAGWRVVLNLGEHERTRDLLASTQTVIHFLAAQDHISFVPKKCPALLKSDPAVLARGERLVDHGACDFSLELLGK